MATGFEGGKTLGVPVIICKACTEDEAAKFCFDCQQEFCTRCIKIHENIQSTKYHKLVSLADRHTSKINSKRSKPVCFKHPTKFLDSLCETCLVALCRECRQDHRNHKILTTGLDAQLLQRITIQKVPELMDILQELETQKDGSPQKLELYKAARYMVKYWRDRLGQIVNDDAKFLLGNIEKEIKKQEILLADISSSLKNGIACTDQQISILSNARRLPETADLFENIQKSDQLSRYAKQLLSDIESTRKEYSIDDLLPFKNELQNAEKTLHNFFTLTPFAEPPRKQSGSAGTKRIGSSGVNAHKTIPTTSNRLKRIYTDPKSSGHGTMSIGHGISYRISENAQYSDIVYIYDVAGTEVRVLNTTNKTVDVLNCSLKITNMTTLSSHRHVILESRTGKLWLLNESMNPIHTIDFVSNGFTIVGLCRKSTSSFIVAQRLRGRARFTEVHLCNDDPSGWFHIFEDDIGNFNGLVALHEDQSSVTCDGSKRDMLVTLNLKTKSQQVHQLSNGISSLCADDDGNVIIGDVNGRVHIMGTAGIQELKGLCIPSEVTGIATQTNKITIMGKNKHLYVFE